eukprot:8152647-Pyramimonas_sp.AAC.1
MDNRLKGGPGGVPGSCRRRKSPCGVAPARGAAGTCNTHASNRNIRTGQNNTMRLLHTSDWEIRTGQNIYICTPVAVTTTLSSKSFEDLSLGQTQGSLARVAHDRPIRLAFSHG